jgi:cell division protein FtsB
VLRRRRPTRPRLRARWLALAAIGLVGLLYVKPLHSYFDTRAQLSRRNAEVRALRAQKAALEVRVANAGSGRVLLRQARLLGMVKPGERLFIVQGIRAWLRAHRSRPAPAARR